MAAIQRLNDQCALITIVLGYIVWTLYALWDSFNLPCTLSGDYSIVVLNALRAGDLDLLTGMHSRFGFAHPGPIVFYYYALFQALAPELTFPYGPLLLAQAILTITMIGVGCFGLGRIFRSTSLVPASFFLALSIILQHDPSLIINIWPPITLAAATFCLLCLTATAITRSEIYLTGTVLSGGIIVSQHLGGVILVTPCIATVAWIVLRGKSTKQALVIKRTDIILSVLIGCIIIAGPLTDLILHGSKSNLLKLLHFSSKQTTQHTLTVSVQYILSFFDSHLFGFSSWWIIGMGAIACVIRRNHQWLLRAYIPVLIVVPLAIRGAMQISKAQHSYIMYWLYGVHWYLVLFSIGSIASTIQSRSCTSFQRQKIFSVIMVSLSLCALLTSPRPTALGCGLQPYEAFAAQIAAEHLEGVRLEPYRLSGWDRIGSLAVWLRMYNVPYCVPRRYARMHGASHVCRSQAEQPDWRVLSVVKVGSALDRSYSNIPATELEGFHFRLMPIAESLHNPERNTESNDKLFEPEEESLPL